jgi:hypothetical protein
MMSGRSRDEPSHLVHRGGAARRGVPDPHDLAPEESEMSDDRIHYRIDRLDRVWLCACGRNEPHDDANGITHLVKQEHQALADAQKGFTIDLNKKVDRDE